jgi:hypothetical protein
VAVLAVQYLEGGPGVAVISPLQARERLRAAFERLPISILLLGWNLPAALVEACAEETALAGAQLYGWHPVLTSDGTWMPQPEWYTIGLDEKPVLGYQGLPEFTFACPNQPPVREAVATCLQQTLRDGFYQGLLLDRIRYPSPSKDPVNSLACFCEGCRRAAAADGLDLEGIRLQIGGLSARPGGAKAFVGELLDRQALARSDPDLAALSAFLDFRARTVTRFVQAVIAPMRAKGLEVGLDCFSPALTRMVGQDLTALNLTCDWIKVMAYGHTLAPAGLPFELLGLADWLVDRDAVDESDALAWLSATTGLPLPSSRGALRDAGLAPNALEAEVRHARSAGVRRLLLGIELVEIAEVVSLNPAEIAADLCALRGAGTDGLVLSWDLWHMPLERLSLVHQIWSEG